MTKGINQSEIDDEKPAPTLPSSPPDEPYFSYTEEPHASRRRAILAAHPEVKDLQGHDWRTKYFVVAAVTLQVYLATQAGNWPLRYILVCAFMVGGPIVQFLTLAIHEMSHGLLFKKPQHNTLFSFFANFPLVFAYAVSFRKYHLDHHKWQGEQDVDMDVPSPLENTLFKHNSLTKFLWVFFQVLFYALRPVIMKPYKPSRWDLANWVCCLAFDYFLISNFGLWSVGYLLLSMLLGLGIHPLAGHFIAEHYVFVPGHETYSYYGPLNFWNIWVGYHNEHHDLPRVPGSRLHKLRELAPEFYENLPQYTSYTKVIWDYIFRPDIGPASRMTRRSAIANKKRS